MRPNDTLPRLDALGQVPRLLVDGRPFWIRGGETGNSLGALPERLAPVWQGLAGLGLNTVLIPAYWELLEPEEGRFDFTSLDLALKGARRAGLRLILLWFGSWKNSMSCYVPGWVKTDTGRFLRACDAQGRPQEILSPFHRPNLEADKAAYVRLVDYLARHDRQHTVIMIQVENEIGMLPTARDHCAPAEAAWQAETAGWPESRRTDIQQEEAFQARAFARYVNEIVLAGKAVKNLPVLVNAALNAPGKLPGEYPSAGPLPHLLDEWKAAGPDIDLLCPDFYNPDFAWWCDRYYRPGTGRTANPLLVPESQPGVWNGARALAVMGRWHGLGFSPFAIEGLLESGTRRAATGPEEAGTVVDPAAAALRGAYGLIGRITQAVHQAFVRAAREAVNPRDLVEGTLLDHRTRTQTVTMAGWELTFGHHASLSWSGMPKDGPWPEAGAVLIRGEAEGEFFLAGQSVILTARPAGAVDGRPAAGILLVETGDFRTLRDGTVRWQATGRLCGDETHQGRHIRITPERWEVQRFVLYRY